MMSGVVSQAHADFLLEPYIGYHTGNYEMGTFEQDMSGITYGARAGFTHALGLMGGIDYMSGKWEDDANPSSDLTPSTLGVFVGFEFPILLRVYGVYSITNEMKAKNSAGTSKYEGDGAIKLGVGFTALPILSINLEYIKANFDEADGAALSPEMETSMFGLTVSAPFEL